MIRRTATSRSKVIRLLRILSFLDSRSQELFKRELAAIEAEEAQEAQGSLLSGSGGGDVADSDGLVPREAPVDQFQVSLTPPPGFASWEDALGLGGQGFVGGIPG